MVDGLLIMFGACIISFFLSCTFRLCGGFFSTSNVSYHNGRGGGSMGGGCGLDGGDRASASASDRI